MRDRTEAKARAAELVSRMTLEEKASQLRYDAPAIDRLGIPAYNWWNEVLHGVARAGTATVFPQAIALAAMFDEDLQEKIADVISDEARAKYNGQSGHGAQPGPRRVRERGGLLDRAGSSGEHKSSDGPCC